MLLLLGVMASFLIAYEAKAAATDRIAQKVTDSIQVTALIPEPQKRIPDALVRIEWCESGARQFLDDGSVVRGPDGHDIGRFQIRNTVHEQDARAHGWDIYSDEGNTSYALWLYQQSGLTPWESSRGCWNSLTALRAKGYTG